MAALQDRNGSYYGSCSATGAASTPSPVGQGRPGRGRGLRRPGRAPAAPHQAAAGSSVPAGVAHHRVRPRRRAGQDARAGGGPPEPADLRQRSREKYLEAHRDGAMEANSLATAAMHLRPLRADAGRGLPAGRAHPGRPPAARQPAGEEEVPGPARCRPVTLRKEVATFRAAWNWAAANGLVAGPFPAKGLVYPKADEKPPFMTWHEIERKAGRGGTVGRGAVAACGTACTSARRRSTSCWRT